MPAPVPRPPVRELQRVLNLALAARLGITRSRIRTEVRRGNWRVLAAGVVLTRPDPPSRYDWLEAALLTCDASAAVSGWDGAVLRGIRANVPPGARPLVLVRSVRSRHCGPVLIRHTDRPYTSHRLPLDHPHLPLAELAAPARCVADAALGASLPAVRSLVAGAVQRGLCGVDELQAELAACPRNGSGWFRVALGEVALGARSAAEAVTLNRLRRSSLPVFELNVPVVDAAGRVIYVVDVLWRRYRAALEIDSREYHFSAAQWQATMRRHNALTAAALSVLHFPPSTLLDPGASWLAEVERWLRSRAAELAEPYIVGSPRRHLPHHEPEALVVSEAA